MGDYATLEMLDDAFGNGSSAAWLVLQLANLNKFSGTKNMDDGQTEGLAYLLAQEYRKLKVSQVLLFFFRFKCGDFGKFWGKVDPMVITCALKDFLSECENKRQEYLNEDYEARKAEEERIMNDLRNRWDACHGEIVRNCQSEDDKRLFDDVSVHGYDKQNRIVYFSAYKETIDQIESDRLLAIFKPAFQRHFPTLYVRYYVRRPKQHVPERLTRQPAPKKKMESVADILAKAKAIVNNVYGADADTLQQMAWEFQQRHFHTPEEYIEKFDGRV